MAGIVEQLRVYKQVCQKIRSILVSGRGDVVSPAAIGRTLIDTDRLRPIPILQESSSGAVSSADPSSDGRSDECPFVEQAEGWKVEYREAQCEVCGTLGVCSCPRPHLNVDLHPLAEAAYRLHFYQQEHWNYFTDEPDIGACVLSIKQQPASGHFRILVRSSDHYLHGLVSAPELGASRYDREEVVAAMGKEMNLLVYFKPATLPNLQEELLKIDETFVKANLKVGLLKVKEGQRTEEEIFANGQDHGPFEEFLNIIGSRVKLRGFKKFLGGLDGERDMTGEESVFAEHEGLQIMFHVSPLMPFTPTDPQQVNKKRHVGNDIVCVVFLDNAQTVFNPSWVRSNFIHCYVIVQHTIVAHGQPMYKVAVSRRCNVPLFTPELRHMSAFAHSTALTSFLHAKVINAERASYHAPKFMRLTNRARAQLLVELVVNLTEHTIASKQGRATRKLTKHGNWLPLGANRPPSPLLDSVREKHSDFDQLGADFNASLLGPELTDVVFLVGEDQTPVYAAKAVLCCRNRVFRHMFKETGTSFSPLSRKRFASSPSTSHQLSPRFGRKATVPGPKPSRLPLSGGRKKVDPQAKALLSDLTSPQELIDEQCSLSLKDKYIIEDFTKEVFSELINYLMTGSCIITPSNVVGLACAAEKYEVVELRQACTQRFMQCLSVADVCPILTQLEKYVAFSVAKSMVVKSLEFVDSNAESILTSKDFLFLSENMVHLVLTRDANVEEIVKVKAALAWGEQNTTPEGPDFKALVTPLVKHVRLHLIEAQDIMKVVVPSQIFDNDKVMAALAYQVDPESVQLDNYTMFRPRKKSTVLSSR